jgi:hypothetical protein
VGKNTPNIEYTIARVSAASNSIKTKQSQFSSGDKECMCRNYEKSFICTYLCRMSAWEMQSHLFKRLTFLKDNLLPKIHELSWKILHISLIRLLGLAFPDAKESTICMEGGQQERKKKPYILWYSGANISSFLKFWVKLCIYLK